ncbi:MAG TPA: phosphatidate cytidylyltransferase [Patescibacteria group bacterium]|nr:phosphatidate cytidylyltransferase [Patescibacteria group bacterium]
MNSPAPVFYAIGGLWCLLILASLIVFGLKKSKPEKDYTELVLRTKSWWWMIGLFSGAVLSSPPVAIGFLGFVSFLAFKEFVSQIPTRRADRRVLFWAYLSIPVQFYWAATAWYGMFIIFIPVYMFLFIGFRMIIAQATQGFLKAAATIHWGLMTCVFSVSHLAYLFVLPQIPVGGSTGGAGLLLFLVFLTQFNDVAQYCWGKTFGKHKVIPLVSPKKTWEGLLGGIFTTVAASVLLAPYLTPFSMLHAALAALIIGVFGFIGDVSISAIKRDLGVKDMGHTIPGHGGIMDRIDSLTFTAPLFFHFTYYLYY